MKSLQWPEFIWPISPMWLYSQSPQGTEYTTPGNFSFDNSIGETGNFKRRIKQHDYDVGKRHMASNALAEHADSSGHEINWGAARILAKEKNLTSRLYLESLIIQTTERTLNRTQGNLPPVYSHCLRHILRRT